MKPQDAVMTHERYLSEVKRYGEKLDELEHYLRISGSEFGPFREAYVSQMKTLVSSVSGDSEHDHHLLTLGYFYSQRAYQRLATSLRTGYGTPEAMIEDWGEAQAFSDWAYAHEQAAKFNEHEHPFSDSIRGISRNLS